MPTTPTILNNDQPVTTEAELNAAIGTATTESSGTYEIEIDTTISLSSSIAAIDLQPGALATPGD